MVASPIGEGDDELDQYLLVELMFAIIASYLFTSLVITLKSTLSPSNFTLAMTSFVALVWTVKYRVIAIISPALVRLFGTGGQGHLHLLSLWFVDPRDLTPAQLAFRVFAGSYSSVLAAIYFTPLVVVVYVYGWYLNEVVWGGNIKPKTTTTTTVEEDISVPHAPTTTTTMEINENRFLLTAFDLNAFQVLCVLGKGVTSSVVLAKVNRSYNSPLPSLSSSQTGSLWLPSPMDHSTMPIVSTTTTTTASTPLSPVIIDPPRPRISSLLPLPSSSAISLHDEVLRDMERGEEFKSTFRSRFGSRSQLRVASEETIKSKLLKNSISMTKLSAIASSGFGSISAGGETLADWLPNVQWINEEQRQESGMDKVFAIAPGLDPNQIYRGAYFPSATSVTSENNDSYEYDNVTEVDEESEEYEKDSRGDLQHENGRLLISNLEEMPDLVAIKIMHKEDIERMGMKKTVENERQALAICGSPFVCNLYGAFQDTKWAYLLLEPVPAGDLAGLLDQRQVMYEDEAMFYIASLLLALEHLHQRGICCLDVKPENILLDQYGYCKLCDLGIAKFLPIHATGPSEERRRHWEFIGTPEYMSPEVVCRDAIIPGMVGVCGPDLWATGILMYELLGGETPFTADTNQEVVAKIQRYVASEKMARSKTMSTYERWTSRVRSLSSDSDRHSTISGHAARAAKADAKPVGEEDWEAQFEALVDTTPELAKVFHPVRHISAPAKLLVHKLLIPNPRKRLGCSHGGLGAAAVMRQGWFVNHDFDFDALRRREIKAPFVPNPLTISPPFRGEDIEMDITREKPLALATLQGCQGFLRAHAQPQPPLNQFDSWKGFGHIPYPTPPLDTKSKNFIQNVHHVQRLYRDNDS
ncbi:hypothetical protein BASA82_000500 [Batrachochytrium salamandrivorans]|nr:hypothetical protein BASA81_003501 [Batrachochytrium salamandrivorans]KAH9262432.1 hypothetical protein BASA82_000500 [Batrachochytrium salamandrivorans]